MKSSHKKQKEKGDHKKANCKEDDVICNVDYFENENYYEKEGDYKEVMLYIYAIQQ